MSTTAKTICCYCGVGCGIVVNRDRWGRLSLHGDEDYPVNRGMLCTKGRYLHQVAMDRSDRLRYPMMRSAPGQPLERTDWDTALDRAAAVFREAIAAHGPEAVGFYVSGQFLTEEYYVANKLMKGFIGSNNIDTNSRLCMSSAVAGYKMTLGEDAPPISYADIEQCACFLIAGANPAWCHPILFRRIEQHKAQHPDVKIIVVDPRRTQTCALADLHLQIYPGTDVTLYNAIAKVLIERGLIDRPFVARHTEGLDALQARVARFDLKEAARTCRVPAAQIVEAAELIGWAPTFLSMWAMGLNQSVVGTRKNLALINLNLLTGQVGKPGAGPFSLTGQPNAMGGREVGGLSNLLAAHRDLANPHHRAEVAAYWGVEDVPEKPGLTATEMFEALEDGRLRVLWIMCTNPAVSIPNARRLDQALRRADYVIVQDISKRSDTLQHADLVLPAAAWLEKQGTMTNSERRISYLPRLIDPPGSALPDVQILCRFAEKMGWQAAFDYADESAIFDEYKGLTRGTHIDISGVSYARLQREGSLQWPCPAEDHPGTERLFEDGRFWTPTGRACLHAVPEANASEPASEDYPFVLTTGRIRDQWHTMTKTGKVSRLRQHVKAPFLEIHPDDAGRLGLGPGDVAAVTSRQGEVRARVSVTDTIKPGVVFLPMHWGRTLNGDLGRANNLTGPRVDPTSGEPDFKFTAVHVARVVKGREKIVVVGAGAAARQFVESYRAHNAEDELHVFGREPYLFYNRILLPEYINEERSWESLLTCNEETLQRLKVHYHGGMEITRIDRRRQYIQDALGRWHRYDKLVLATGSRAFIPPGVPMDLAGVFSLRARHDADRIKAFLPDRARVVIMGGGLLGLELAAALEHIGIRCTIVEMFARLMHRQLDPEASELLREELEDRGIEVLCGDSITEYMAAEHGGRGRIRAVRTQHGREIPCDALFVTVGTRPNIDLATAVGLDHNRGVRVNDHLQTSDPAIFAMGEIAEHRDRLYGITPAAYEQAEVLAAYLAGDLWARYEGSTLFNILKIHGLDVCAIGTTTLPDGDPDYDEVTFLDRRGRYYKKCIIYKNRLVGAILIGDKSEFSEFKMLIDQGIELEERRDELLRRGGPPREAPVGRLVCTCNDVGEGNLRRLIDGGCRDFAALCTQSRAGTGCGSCRPEVQMILEDHLTDVVIT